MNRKITTWKAQLGLAVVGSALAACGASVQQTALPAPHQLPVETPELWQELPLNTQTESSSLRLPEIPVSTVSLSNGLQLSVAERPGSTTTALRMWVPGASGDPHGAVAAMVNALQAGSALPSGKVLLNPRLSGRAISSWTGRRGSFFSWTVLPRASKTALRLLASYVTRPRFEAEEIPGSLKQSLNWLQQYSWSPDYFHDMAANAVPGLEFAATDDLAREILALSPEALHQVHACRVSPEGAHLVVVGAVSQPEVQAWAEQAFSGWSKQPQTGCDAWRETPPPQEEALSRPELFVKGTGAPDPHVTIMLPAPPPTHEDFAAFALVANAMAVDQDGVASQMRHSGASYGIHARVNTSYPDRALLELAGSISPDGATDSLRSMVTGLRDFSTTVTDEDFAIVKRRVLTTMTAYASDASGIANQIMSQVSDGRSVQEASGWVREVLEVEPEAARAAAARWTDNVEPVILAYDPPRVRIAEGLRINARATRLRTREVR